MAPFLQKPSASVSVTLSNKTIRLGEALTGTLHVSSEEAFDVEEVAVEVTGIVPKAVPDDEEVLRDYTFWWSRERVTGPLRLMAGSEEKFPFTVKLPTSPCYTRNGKPWVENEYRNWRKTHWPSESVAKTEEMLQTLWQEHPEWRTKIEWEVKGIVFTKGRTFPPGRRDIIGNCVNFKVLASSLTLEEEAYIRTRDVEEQRRASRRRRNKGIIQLVGGVIIVVFITVVAYNVPAIRARSFEVFSMYAVGLPFVIYGLYDIVRAKRELHKVSNIQTS